MKKHLSVSIILILLLAGCNLAMAQSPDARISEIESKLKSLELHVPGLTESAYFSASGVSVQEFLRGMAEAHNLNISIDPSVNVKVYNNFKGEKVSNVLLFLCKEHSLGIRFTGSIMSFYKYHPPEPEPPIVPTKEVNLRYNVLTKTVSADLNADAADKVTKKFITETKQNLILAPGTGSIPLSGYIENLPLASALQKLAFANGLNFYYSEDSVFVWAKNEELSTTEEPGTKTKSSNPAGIKNNNLKNSTKAPENENQQILIKADSVGKTRITLTADNKPVLDLIKEVSAKCGINYFMLNEPKGNSNSVFKDLLYEEFLQHIFQGSEFTFTKQDSIYIIGERKTEGIRITKSVAMQYRSVKKIDEFIPAELKKGVELKVSDELNSVILSGSAPNIAEIENFLYAIDKSIPMITIEVILLDVAKRRSTTTGIKAGLSDSIPSGGTFMPGIDFTLSSRSINDILFSVGNMGSVNLGKVNKNFYLSLNALESNSNATVRSTPKLSTLNGHEATLKIGRTRYYQINTQNVIGGLNNQSVFTQQWNKVDANMSVKILPMVSGNENVTLEIEVEVSDFVGDPPNNAPPPTATSAFKSMVRARDGDMIVLGGLEKIERSDSGSGLPFLSRVPVIKWFFSSRTRSKNKTKSLIFIKPTIVH